MWNDRHFWQTSGAARVNVQQLVPVTGLILHHWILRAGFVQKLLQIVHAALARLRIIAHLVLHDALNRLLDVIDGCEKSGQFL